MIHYISPFDINRNYGDNINNAIKQLNPSDDDFICLKDGDSCFLTPDYGNIIHSVIDKGYDLLGCVTNRVSNKRLVPFFNFEDMDLKSHYNKAKSSILTHGNSIIPFNEDIPGYFMLFSVKIWRKTGGFKNSIIFDRQFTKDVKMSGGKVGIMVGLYVLHCYRLWAPTREEAKKSVQHLIK